MRRREPRALPYRYVTLAMLALAWLAVTGPASPMTAMTS
jgi:hypothetical protein